MKTSNSKDSLEQIHTLIAQNRYLDALTAIDRYLVNFSKDEEAYLLKGGILQLLERRTEAITLYEWMIKKFPRCTDAYAELIEIHALPPRTEQDDKRIISLCETLQSIDPHKTPYEVMGEAFMNLGDNEAALAAFDKAVEQQKLNTAANLIIIKSPKYNADIKEMARNELNENKLHDAYCEKARVLETLGCYIEAINDYEEAIRINRSRGGEYESCKEYEAIGNIYEALGDEVNAKHYLKMAQQLEQTDRDHRDVETYGITEHDFDEWFDRYVVLDQEGKIQRIRKEDEKSDSFIVQWAETKKKELRFSNQITPENMFAGFIYGLSSFAKSTEQFKSGKDMESSAPFSLARFANDSALFELGCYHYFQVDMWLFAHCPDLRQWVSQVFIREFILLLTQALQISNVAELFRQRVEKYGEIARTGGNAEDYHRHLSQLILRTKDNQRPKPYDFDNEPPQLVFEDMLLKMAIANWEIAMVPAMIESMEATTKLLKRSS